MGGHGEGKRAKKKNKASVRLFILKSRQETGGEGLPPVGGERGGIRGAKTPPFGGEK